MDSKNITYFGRCNCHGDVWLDHYHTKIYLGYGKICYSSGGGYILKSNILPEYLRAAKYLPFYMPVEDYTTGFIMKKIRKPCKVISKKEKWLAISINESNLQQYSIIHTNKDFEKVKLLNKEIYGIE